KGEEDVAIMMVEAEATEHSWDLIKGGATKPDEAVVAQGLEAAKPFLKQLMKAAMEVQEYPVFLSYDQATYDVVAGASYDRLKDIYQIADKIERQNADDALKDEVKDVVAAKVAAGELPETAN